MSAHPDPILITGGAGFIGTHLTRLLVSQGHAVRVLDLVPPKSPVPGAQYLQGDIRNEWTLAEALRGVRAVYHFAAIVSVPLCQEQPHESFTTNLGGTSLVLETVRQEQLRQGRKIRVLFAGSSAVYGALGQPGIPLKESDTLPPPLSFYGAQKLGSEHLMALYHEVHGVPATCFRFFNVYGPGQDPKSPYSGVISIFTLRTRQGEPLQLHGGGTQTRDFISVHDLVRACAAALELPETACDGRPINLGTGKTTTVRELAELAVRLQGSSSTISVTPPRSGDVRDSLADSSRARTLLGWEPRVSLEKGLGELL
ncbi:MAG: GDP-mannose 4,6-dehydratase [Oligoflexia bacterium]|nr:GDP-mannose 4,6-dehydratase [Oligoflexia bacterium]